MENKICPLLSIAGPGPMSCGGERCAWYVPPVYARGTPIREGYCAVQALGALPGLVQKVGQI